MQWGIRHPNGQPNQPWLSPAWRKDSRSGDIDDGIIFPDGPIAIFSGEEVAATTLRKRLAGQ
jgi:hypothetical protein